jgi:hypothetical protein
MQTLGLSSESKRNDGRLKSLLWPTVQNAWDVDYLGQQGMWICTVVAVLTLVGALLSANIIIIAIGIIAALFYIMGGMGVRQANWPAAALVFVVYFANLWFGVSLFSPINLIRFACAFVLLSNVRGAFLASEWKPVDGEDVPTRFNDSLADRYIDQMPAKLWPKLQMPFIVLAIVMLLFTAASWGLVIAKSFHLLPRQ